MIKNRPASIVLYALMVLSVIVLLMQQMMRGVFVGSNFMRTMIDRERAEMLALSGVTIAMAQLMYDEKEDDEQGGRQISSGGEAEGKPLKGVKRLLMDVIPHLNRWQEFKLIEKIDGLDGLIRICVTCESGKINVNEAFDFEKMEFKQPYEALLKGLEIPGKLPPGEMVNKLAEYLKNRKRKLDDISELQDIQGFKALDIFYRPRLPAAKGKKNEPNQDLMLQDIFTTWTADDKIDLLWLSDALCAIIGVRRPLANDAVMHKDRFKQFVQSFKKDMASDWDANWKAIEALYDQKPKNLPELKNIFTKVFGPKVFSVLSCGNVGQVEQHILAVIREEDQQAQKSGEEGEAQVEQSTDESSKEPKKKFRILRTYWL